MHYSHVIEGRAVLDSSEAGVQRLCKHSPQLHSGLILAHPHKPKHKLESLDPASTQAVQKNYIPGPFSQLADRFLKSSRNHFILPGKPSRGLPGSQGSWGAYFSVWKNGCWRWEASYERFISLPRREPQFLSESCLYLVARCRSEQQLFFS